VKARLGIQIRLRLGIIDSQSANTTEATMQGDRGFAAGKKVNGRKRHILVDVCGIILAVVVTVYHARLQSARSSGEHWAEERAEHASRF
jgi:hypothetical protein